MTHTMAMLCCGLLSLYSILAILILSMYNCTYNQMIWQCFSGMCHDQLEVSNCDNLRHHDSRIMTYHDGENYHDY